MRDIVIFQQNSYVFHHWGKVLKDHFESYRVFSINLDSETNNFVENLEPHLVLIDVTSSIDPIPIIKHYERKKVPIAILINQHNKHKLNELFQHNITGYLLDDMIRDKIIYSIHKLLNGEHYIHPKLSVLLLLEYRKRMKNTVSRPSNLLSKREWEILSLIIDGKNTGEISKELYISPKTVANHIASIYKRLNVRDRVDLVLLAIRKRWFVL